jgi:hypothetical protein
MEYALFWGHPVARQPFKLLGREDNKSGVRGLGRLGAMWRVKRHSLCIANSNNSSNDKIVSSEHWPCYSTTDDLWWIPPYVTN